jgi:hypothetical protein
MWGQIRIISQISFRHFVSNEGVETSRCHQPSNPAVESDGHKLRLWFPTLCSGRPSLPR